MHILQAIHSTFAAATGLNALVANGLFSDFAPEGTAFPYATVAFIANPVDQWTSGKVYIESNHLQFDIWTQDSAGLPGLTAVVQMATQLKATYDWAKMTLDPGEAVLAVRRIHDSISSAIDGPGALPVWRATVLYDIWVQRILNTVGSPGSGL